MRARFSVTPAASKPSLWHSARKAAFNSGSVITRSTELLLRTASNAEMIFAFTHSQEMPWILPGVPPTHRRVEVPLVVIVHFRDGKLAHEHIYWDQASVLKQIGLLNDPALPVFGAETARKVVDPSFKGADS